MKTSHTDISLNPQQGLKFSEQQLQKQLKDGVSEFKTEVTERPFFYLAIAFTTGLVARTFPVRLIFAALMRLVSFLSGPAILVMGIIKLSELFSEFRSGAANQPIP